ncbi:MAG: ATP-grasp domain-containing protein [Candidatus Omnitrophica bacterium]|nr:ATP-grasp domain-containing protein [Candidatus Omnitrophota bacterium]
MKDAHVLVIHSGSSKKRFILETAQMRGIRVTLLNPQQNWASEIVHKLHVCRPRTVRGLEDRVRSIHAKDPVDGVLTFWEEDVPTVALCAQRLGLRGLSPDSAWASRSKLVMRRRMAQMGLPVPAFQEVETWEDAAQFVREHGAPAVLKPEFGADSECVVKVEDESQAQWVFDSVLGRARIQSAVYPYQRQKFLIESYIAGPEVSVEGVVQGGTPVFYAVIDKSPMTEPFFIERGEVTPSRLPKTAQAGILEMVGSAVRALGLRDCGLHAEVKLSAQGPQIVEIGARMGGDCIHGLVKAVYGVDLVEENFKVCLGAIATPTQPARCVAVSETLVPEQSGRVVSVPDLNQWSGHDELIEVVLTAKSKSMVRIPPLGYDNLAWVSVKGRSYREANQALSRWVQVLQESIQIETVHRQRVCAQHKAKHLPHSTVPTLAHAAC